MEPRTFYKLDIQGIVYLVDPVTQLAYTYDLSHPTEIGKVVWTNASDAPRLELRENWRDVLAAKMTGVPMPAPVSE
jgi:hypothetical protein